MNIGIDIRPLQGPHRMRGIGYVTYHTLRCLAPLLKPEDTLVLYSQAEADIPAAKVIDDIGLVPDKITLRLVQTSRRPAKLLPGILRVITKLLNRIVTLREYKNGIEGYEDPTDLDAFIQFDQSMPFPKLPSSTKKILVLYDLIPYVLESDYLWSYRTARQKGLDLRGAVACHLRRKAYLDKLKRVVKYADKLIAISETTKGDFIEHLHITPKKIDVVMLGVETPKTTQASAPTLVSYITTSWGPVKRSYTLDKNEPFLLFVGGADQRRKLDDLVGAFNQLRAQGIPLKLLLTGDTMKGPDSIPTASVKRALLNSSYKNDIVFLGFVEDNTRDWLYQNAATFVFPSLYEGFGLPVLEAMSYGTPVIAYDNKAVREVAGTIPFYARDLQGIVTAVREILSQPKTNKQQRTEQSLLHVRQFTWQKTSENFMRIIKEQS